jgi:hypothetical protein
VPRSAGGLLTRRRAGLPNCERHERPTLPPFGTFAWLSLGAH